MNVMGARRFGVRGTVAGVLALGLGLGVPGGEAWAQYGNANKKSVDEAGSGAVLQRSNAKDLTLRATINLRMLSRDEYGNAHKAGAEFDTAAVVFPLLKGSASHAGGVATGTLKVDGILASEKYETLTGYPAGTELGKWSFKDTFGSSVTLEVTQPVTCSRTTLNESAAEKLDWPKAWPEEAQSAMARQWYVDLGAKGPLDMTPVKDQLSKWMGGRDPKSLPPAKLAKFLAGQTAQLIQTSGPGVVYNRTSEIEGIDVHGALEALSAGKGSDVDLVCLLAAVYRQAGLPARTVFGYEWDGSRNKDRLFQKKGASQYRSWVEFALVDPTAKEPLIWVPVDVVAIRKTSSRVGDLNRPWKGFGTCDDFDAVVPFAFQLIPPTDVVAHGSPAFYGWMVTPKPPENVTQAIRFDVGVTPKSGEDQMKKDDPSPKPQDNKPNLPEKTKKKNPYGK